MIFENTKVLNFEGAIRGMRNPLGSWGKSDSKFDCESCFCKDCAYYDKSPCGHNALFIGENDMKLAKSLIRAGSDHRKFLRQILVSVDITAPLYWWKEFDTYKVGTTANSTSTMHTLTKEPITKACFELSDYNSIIEYDGGFVNVENMVSHLIENLEQLRRVYIKTKDKRVWKEVVRWLPCAWQQKRTVTMTYENLLNMCNARKSHKLNEWSGADNPDLANFIDWAHTLPYADEFIFLSAEEV